MVTSTPAFADERLEAGAFVGVDYFGDDIGLGGSLAPEQRPQTSPKLGGRLTYVIVRTGRDIRFDLGAEGELSFTPAWTGYGFDSERPSYFSPLFGFRGDFIARFGAGFLQPHVLVGAGGVTVVSSSPYMKKETQPVYFWGAGATFAVSGNWLLRFDGRQVRMNARDVGMGDAGMTNAYEFDLSIGRHFGAPQPRLSTREHVGYVVDTRPADPQPEPDRDSDNDGIPDRLDTCPREAEVANGVDDGDGCPEPDPDRDNLVGASDKCPDAAEDFDKFEDDDGCPDLDNDRDGVADAQDACPSETETKNGIADDDGCADQVPVAITKAFAAANKAIKFDAGKMRLTPRTKAALDKTLPVLLSNRNLKIAITVHPHAAGDAAVELANKRAEAVKWYLNESGIAAANMTVTVGAVAKAPVIELSVAGP